VTFSFPHETLKYDEIMFPKSEHDFKDLKSFENLELNDAVLTMFSGQMKFSRGQILKV
jgi:hypothetical protein